MLNCSHRAYRWLSEQQLDLRTVRDFAASATHNLGIIMVVAPR